MLEEKRDKALNWLSSEDFSEKMQTSISSEIQPGTGEWLLKAPEFQELVAGKKRTKPSLLWGFGIGISDRYIYPCD